MLPSGIAADTFQPVVSLFANIYFFRLLVAGSISLDRFIFLRGILEQASNSASLVASSFQRLYELTIKKDQLPKEPPEQSPN